MRLKIYRAGSVREAMAQVRRELGPEAMILSTRRSAGGVELTAAFEQVDDAPPEPGAGAGAGGAGAKRRGWVAMA
jgi:flagellar biosynthesis protein FlhF